MQNLPLVISPQVLQHVELIKVSAAKYGLNPNLVLALVWQESGGNAQAIRFEPKSTIVCTPSTFAKKQNISFDTEVNFQHCSWGLMQVMGFKLREMQFDGSFFEMDNPKLALDFGCQALQTFKKKYVYDEDVIAAYNAGAPVIVAGIYKNQEYLNMVKEKWAFIEKQRIFG